MINDTEYLEWLSTSLPGDVLVYHTGPHLYGLGGVKKQAAVLAWRDSEQGLVFLAQKRVEDGMFEYRAMRLDDRLGKRCRSWSK